MWLASYLSALVLFFRVKPLVVHHDFNYFMVWDVLKVFKFALNIIPKYTMCHNDVNIRIILFYSFLSRT